MKKEELMKILKPLIKECIRDVIFEEGSLSTIISEVVKSTGAQSTLRESKNHSRLESQEEATRRIQSKKNKIEKNKKRMLDAIGSEAYNGVNLFEGTQPLPQSRNPSSPQGSSPLDGVAPHDPGVDITKFSAAGIWKKLAGN